MTGSVESHILAWRFEGFQQLLTFLSSHLAGQNLRRLRWVWDWQPEPPNLLPPLLALIPVGRSLSGSSMALQGSALSLSVTTHFTGHSRLHPGPPPPGSLPCPPCPLVRAFRLTSLALAPKGGQGRSPAVCRNERETAIPGLLELQGAAGPKGPSESRGSGAGSSAPSIRAARAG